MHSGDDFFFAYCINSTAAPAQSLAINFSFLCRFGAEICCSDIAPLWPGWSRRYRHLLCMWSETFSSNLANCSFGWQKVISPTAEDYTLSLKETEDWLYGTHQ